VSFRLTIERRNPKREGGRPFELRTFPLVTRADLAAAMAVVQDFIQQAKARAWCDSVTLVLHLPDCDHEP